MTTSPAFHPRLICLMFFLLVLAPDGFGGPWKVIDDGCGDSHGEIWEQALGRVHFQQQKPQSNHQLKILEAGRLTESGFNSLKDWVEDGGTLLLSGVPSSETSCLDGNPVSPNRLLELAGLRVRGHDPGLSDAFLAIRDDTPVTWPLTTGDGIRLGREGFGHALGLESAGATILASAYALSGRDLHVHDFPHPALTAKKVGDGHVYFSSVSLGQVAACYPDAAGEATDCSAAASIESLMRLVLANLLWHHHGIQIPVPRQSPGTEATTVVITGDVHSGPAGLQSHAAVEMARVAEKHNIPVTYYVVGEVAQASFEVYRQLAARPNVAIGTHSAHGQQYRLGFSSIPGRRRGGVHGASDVCEDVRRAEAMLGLPHWPGARQWTSSIRTEAWGSNESESEAWTGMRCAGVGLVLDHSGDAITSNPAITPPAIWFDRPARKRLILPSFTTAVHTATDDFRAETMGLDGIYSLASPQPDPCCNRAVPFDLYADYVLDWHDQFKRLGSVLGITQVWLWHPATPATRGAFSEVNRVFEAMIAGGDVLFATADALAAWNFNRRQLQLRAATGPGGRLQVMRQDGPVGPLSELPDNSPAAIGEVSYWVHGEVELDGWAHHVQQTPSGPITILSASIESFE